MNLPMTYIIGCTLWNAVTVWSVRMDTRRLKGIGETYNGLEEDKKQREGSWDRMTGVL